MSDYRERLTQQLILHEGERLKPYRCTEGFITIGVGRNLDTKGISLEESRFLLANDIADAERDARVFFPEFGYLSVNRQIVLIDMAFNLGLGGLLKFRKFQYALERSNYTEAAREMMDSKWAKQVGKRAERLAEMMKNG